MHPVVARSLTGAPALTLGLLLSGGLFAACAGNDQSDSSSSSRLAATSMVRNPAPGEGATAPMMAGPGQPFSGEALEVVQQPLSSGVGGALVLFDTTGPYGALGELYGIGAANLASHFGSWTAKAAVSYTCGEIAGFSAILYLGSTYDEPLPTCLLDDVLATTKPVIWSFYNLWQLAARLGDAAFVTRFGFTSLGLDFSPISEVRYKGRSLARYAANAAGVLNTAVVDATRAQALALAVRPDGTTFPWAMRSGSFTYVGEMPFSYMSEEDRVLVYADLLFDALAPATPERHRALVRLEDISGDSDVAELRAVADYLYSQNIPFGFGVVPEYRDPRGVYNSGRSERIRLQDNRTLSTLLKDMTARGGVLVMHGNTHQWDTAINPYNQVSADDYEFFRVTENTDHTLTYQGPIPGDSSTWAKNRITAGQSLFKNAGLAIPKIFEFPHYSASAVDYAAVGSLFATRWERSLYFNGLLTGTGVNYSRIFGQLFPYVVRDVYGTKVLPENLGNIEPTMFYQYPTRFPGDIIRAAEKNLVVRDGFASFYFHPFFDLSLLRETIDGIRALGYTFVSPATL
jgi:uncharacterized protein YdaL